LEDVNDGVLLSEFTLDDFHIELANNIEANRKALEDAPLGLYAVVPPPTEGSAAQIVAPASFSASSRLVIHPAMNR